jgi:hypothetical protein
VIVFLFLLLTGSVARAALSVAVRARLDVRAETVVATTILACSIVLAPIYLLGVCGALRRGPLAASVVALAAGAVAASTWGVDRRAQMRRTAHELSRIARAPMDVILEAWRRRSPVLPGLLWCFALFAWMLAAAYLAPSWREWDALWYHEPIIGFSIQNGGFATVDLPAGTIQAINGYPRAAEMLSLWFAIFTGRRFIDLASVLLMPGCFAAVYAMTRRATGDRLVSAGWAAVVCTLPVYAELLQTVYVDPALAAFSAASALFVLRTPLRAREALIGALALAITANIKVSGVIIAIPLAMVAAVQLLRASGPGQRGRALLTIASGGALIIALSAATYARNWITFHNPLWPHMRVRVAWLGIDWPGDFEWGETRATTQGQINANMPWRSFLRELFLPPGGRDNTHGDVQRYGLGLVWIVLPASVIAVLQLLRESLFAVVGNASRRDRERLLQAWVLTAVVVLALATSINRTQVRYQLMTIALWIPVVAWTFRRRSPLGESLAFATLVGSFASTAWDMPMWRSFPGPSDLVALWKTDAPQRELEPRFGAPVVTEVGLAREAELTAGKTVITDDFVFPAVLWNNDYSNRVVYVRPGVDLATKADELGATWIYANSRSAADRLRANPDWKGIGALYVEGWGTAFRRVARPIAYTSDEAGGNVAVVDLSHAEVVANIPVGKRPRGVKLSPDRTLLYVALSGSPRGGPGIDESKLPPPDRSADGIGIVDVATRKLVKIIPSGQDPETFDIAPDGARTGSTSTSPPNKTER